MGFTTPKCLNSLDLGTLGALPMKVMTTDEFQWVGFTWDVGLAWLLLILRG